MSGTKYCFLGTLQSKYRTKCSSQGKGKVRVSSFLPVLVQVETIVEGCVAPYQEDIRLNIVGYIRIVILLERLFCPHKYL